MTKIKIEDIKFNKPDFARSSFSKEKTVHNWLTEWVKFSIKNGILNYGDTLPKKADLAAFLGVGMGTVQNAIKLAEEDGIFVSRQSVGTIINNPMSPVFNNKMVSKKDKAVVELKRKFVENNFETGDKISAINVLALELNVSKSTIRAALETMVNDGILGIDKNYSGKNFYYLKNKFNTCEFNDSIEKNVENIPLSSIIAEKMKEYILKNFSQGEKILPNSKFAKMFSVSVRTVNQAAKILAEEKFILPRRGTYGTIFINGASKQQREEKSLFMSSGRKNKIKTTYLYSWEKALDALKKYITQNHGAGDKIPSVQSLSQILNVSTNTIRRAVGVLCEEGYLITQRGKYGGIFVLEVPEKDSEAFTWLAINPSVVKVKQ